MDGSKTIESTARQGPFGAFRGSEFSNHGRPWTQVECSRFQPEPCGLVGTADARGTAEKNPIPLSLHRPTRCVSSVRNGKTDFLDRSSPKNDLWIFLKFCQHSLAPLICSAALVKISSPAHTPVQPSAGGSVGLKKANVWHGRFCSSKTCMFPNAKACLAELELKCQVSIGHHEYGMVHAKTHRLTHLLPLLGPDSFWASDSETHGSTCCGIEQAHKIPGLFPSPPLRSEVNPDDVTM